MTRPSAQLRHAVARRAKGRCEYCRASESQTGQEGVVDHVTPKSQGGANELDNLCLSCGWCNSFKQAQVEGCDELTHRRVRLFHPRRDRWSKHFRWTRARTEIVPLTSIGRVTVTVLRLNRPKLVLARELWNTELKRVRRG